MGNNKKRERAEMVEKRFAAGPNWGDAAQPFLWPKFAKFVVSAIAAPGVFALCDSAEFYCGLSSAAVGAIFIHLFPSHASHKFLSHE
jgi:hypothetical protein